MHLFLILPLPYTRRIFFPYGFIIEEGFSTYPLPNKILTPRL